MMRVAAAPTRLRSSSSAAGCRPAMMRASPCAEVARSPQVERDVGHCIQISSMRDAAAVAGPSMADALAPGVVEPDPRLRPAEVAVPCLRILATLLASPDEDSWRNRSRPAWPDGAGGPGLDR